jgi:hypothetical protein
MTPTHHDTDAPPPPPLLVDEIAVRSSAATAAGRSAAGARDAQTEISTDGDRPLWSVQSALLVWSA